MKNPPFEEVLMAFATGYVGGCVLAMLPPRELVVGAIVGAICVLMRRKGDEVTRNKDK